MQLWRGSEYSRIPNMSNFCVYVSVTQDFVYVWIWVKNTWMNSSVIRQKEDSQNRCFKKTKYAKFYEKRHFLPPDRHTYVCVSGGKECLFFGKFGVLCFFWNTHFEICPFALLPTNCSDHSDYGRVLSMPVQSFTGLWIRLWF